MAREDARIAPNAGAAVELAAFPRRGPSSLPAARRRLYRQDLMATNAFRVSSERSILILNAGSSSLKFALFTAAAIEDL
jgi:hypothetical protein